MRLEKIRPTILVPVVIVRNQTVVFALAEQGTATPLLCSSCLRTLVECVTVSGPGETEKPCVLELVDDDVYEDVEELRLVLGTPQSSSAFGAAVGEQNETLIQIQDDADSKKSLLLLHRESRTEVLPPTPTPGS